MKTVILAVFGDATHPAVNRGARALAASLVKAGLADRVSVAFERGEPNLHRVLDLLEPGPVTVLPVAMELTPERRRALMDGLSQNKSYAEFDIEFAAPLGASPRFREALGTLVWEQSGPAPEDTTAVLVGPGAAALARELSLLNPAGRVVGVETESQVWELAGENLLIQPVLYPVKGRFGPLAVGSAPIDTDHLLGPAIDSLMLSRALRVPQPVAFALGAV